MSRSDPNTLDVLAAVSTPLPGDEWSLSRRRFLQAVSIAGGAALLPAWMADAASAAAPVGPNDGILVLITMGGGNDGLNTVVPIQNGVYYDRRGSLAFPASSTLSISEDRGLHPNLGAIHSLWQSGDVAVIEGVGAPGTDLSHFSSMARWMAGASDDAGFQSGWLGRYIDGLPGGNDPFHGVSIGTSIPLNMQGQHRQASGLPAKPGDIFKVASADAIQRRQYDALAAFGHSSTGRGELADALATSGPRAVNLSATLESVYAAEAPEAALTRKLDFCARLINANVGVRVLHVIYGDFDSHADQPEMHNARMAEFNDAVAAFYARLHPTYGARTLLLTASEFGRRVKANRSNGTDHGAAGTLLAIGTQVRGGFYGELPPLDRLDRQGNLTPTVDFRSVYATVLDSWLGGDSNQILRGGYENLGFVAAPSPARTTSGVNPTAGDSTFRYRAQIVRLYKAFFGRLPETSGFDYWVDARRSGTSLINVATTFAASAEFVNQYGHLNNAQFVDLLYRNVMGRAPDSGGLAHWSGLLDNGHSRGEVMIGFSESDEYVRGTAADVKRVDEAGPVARLYLAYFLRKPDADGLRFWIGSGLPYRAISDAFAASNEFQQRYGALSDDGFVDLVYENVFSRGPDAEGRAFWLSQLASGQTRGQIMLALSESTEFINKTGTLR